MDWAPPAAMGQPVVWAAASMTMPVAELARCESGRTEWAAQPAKSARAERRVEDAVGEGLSGQECGKPEGGHGDGVRWEA